MPCLMSRFSCPEFYLFSLELQGDAVLSKASRYRLKELSYSDSGVYTCEANVPSVPGLRKEQSITIVVEGETPWGCMHINNK